MFIGHCNRLETTRPRYARIRPILCGIKAHCHEAQATKCGGRADLASKMVDAMDLHPDNRGTISTETSYWN